MSGGLKRRALLAALAAGGAGAASAQALPGSFENWRRLFGGAQAAADEAGRLQLLAEGEALLRSGDALAAQDLFQRAAMRMHSPDTECSIVRAQMQAGAYRQALAFGAHAALAHRGFAGGVALYAWMLHVGGQSVVAARLLGDALQRHPGHPALLAAREGLRTPWPAPGAELLAAPLRAAPYAHGDADSAPLRCAGTGTLMPDGLTAWVPGAMLGSAQTLHVRNGLGQTRQARIVDAPAADGIVALRLSQPLPVPDGLALAARPPFAGSPLAVVEYGSSDSGDAGWPQLVQGFAGGMANDGTLRLGVELARGPRGGPVFDRFGRLAGIALPGEHGPDGLRMIDPAGAADAMAGHVSPVDSIYEAGLRMSLQILLPRSA